MLWKKSQDTVLLGSTLIALEEEQRAGYLKGTVLLGSTLIALEEEPIAGYLKEIVLLGSTLIALEEEPRDCLIRFHINFSGRRAKSRLS